MHYSEGTIQFFIGDVLYDGFETASLRYMPLESALDDLGFQFDIRPDDMVLINRERVSRTWYILQPGDEVAILRDSNANRESVESVMMNGDRDAELDERGFDPDNTSRQLPNQSFEGQDHASVEMMPGALDKDAAAAYIGVKPSTLDYLVRTRKLRYVQVGKQRGRIFKIQDLNQFLEDNTQLTATELLRKHGRK